MFNEMNSPQEGFGAFEQASSTSDLVIPSLEGFAGELAFEDVAALGLSKIEGADTLGIPLVGRVEADATSPSARSMTSAPSTPFPTPTEEPTYQFGMKERALQPVRSTVCYDQSFFM